MTTTNTQHPHRVKHKTARLTANMSKYHDQDDAGYGALAIAIIKQAAQDYVTARLAVQRAGTKQAEQWERNHRTRAVHRMDEIRRFFHSAWFGVLCDVDPDVILKRLEEKT